MRTQKELQNIFADCIRDAWDDEDMQKYCIKQAAYIIELNGGEIVEIEKPRIKKDFCFGYGYCGCSSIEDYEDAQDMAQYARSDEGYFIMKNLEPLEGYIQDLQRAYPGEVFIQPKYYGQTEKNVLRSYRFLNWGGVLPDNARTLEPEEIAAIIAGYEEVKTQFKKRLYTYLKKYGLSKVNSWSYLRD